MADLFREVDEVMRQERIEKFWAENKSYIVSVILGTILLTGLISGYRSWDNSVKEKQTARIIALQEAEDYPQNILETEKLDMRAGHRAMALLKAAAVFLDQDKTEEAGALYQRVAQDIDLPAEFKELAILMSVRLLSDQDDADAQALLDQLKPVVNNPKSPWVHHARIEAAVLQADKLQNYAAALQHLNAVIDTPDLPASLTERAVALVHLYSLKQPKTESKQDKSES
ncbi:MAG: hypothetical protein H6861_09300 [Rhodospirillales bacterium]|nr:hypothetical protein [Rhodospirillales bacterium]